MSSLKYNFRKFVEEIVDDWIKKYGAGGAVSPFDKGANAVDYIITNKIKKLKPQYFVEKSKGSRTPADIYLLASMKNNGKQFWHLMLIQVKGRVKGDSYGWIDVKKFQRFAEEDVKEKIKTSKHSVDFKNDTVIISIGFANVHKKNIYHKLEKAEMYPDGIILYNHSDKIPMEKFMQSIINVHRIK